MLCLCGEDIDTDLSHKLGVYEIDCRCGRVYAWDKEANDYIYRITRKLARIYDLEEELDAPSDPR